MAQATQGGAFLQSSGSLKADLTLNTAITLNVTPGMLVILEQMALDSHQPLEVVLTRAIALYRAALDAKADGKHIGYSGSPEGLEVEFTGFNGPESE